MVEDIVSAKRSEMRRLINESFGYSPVDEGEKNIAEDMIRVDCDISDRYSVLNFVKFLKENSDKNIDELTNTLTALKKYGYELLKDNVFRRGDWREINMKTYIYKEQIADIKGAEDILKMLGYVIKIDGKLCFSECIKEPIKDAVISILIDVIVAKEELDSFAFSSHPQPEELQRIFEARKEKDRIVSTTYIIRSRSSNCFQLQRVDSNDDWGVIDRPHETESLDLPPCILCGVSKGKIECKDCMCSHCVECDREWHMHPKRKNHKNRINKEDCINGDYRSRGSSKLTSNEDSTKFFRTKTDSVVPCQFTTASVRLDQITEMHSNSTSSDKPHAVPEATHITDANIYSRLQNERQNIEPKLGRIVEQLKETEKYETKYLNLKIEQKNLLQRWREIGLILGDIVVTEQPRCIGNSANRGSSSPLVDNDADHSLNLSFVKKNIRRPPSEDPYYEYEEMKDLKSRNGMYTGMENKGWSSSLRNNYPECINNEALEMVENHYSNNTPVGWKCQHCTFINRSFDTIICEMCSKTTEKDGRETSI